MVLKNLLFLHESPTESRMSEIEKIDTELFDPTVEPVAEKIHRVVRGAISSVPALGGALNEMFLSMLESPLDARRTEWMYSVSIAINRLIEKRHVTIESLRGNDQFIDVLIQATLIAQKTSQRGKLTALRNAVSNSTTVETKVVSKSGHFLRLIDTFDEWHLRVLDFYSDPNRYYDLQDEATLKAAGVGLLTLAFPELRGEEEYATSLWFDLKHAGLLRPPSIGETAVLPSLEKGKFAGYGRMTTALAAEFLAFISDVNLHGDEDGLGNLSSS
jgi:hypothetical protein